MKKVYLAHTTDENGKKITCKECREKKIAEKRNCQHDEEVCHKLKDHLTKTAELAKEKASVFGAGDIAYVLGLLHDIGKYSDDFQDKIRGKNISAPHAMYGSVVFNNTYGNDRLIKYLSICLASHHTGLMNLGNEYDYLSYLGKLQEAKTFGLPTITEEIKLPETLVHNLNKIVNRDFLKYSQGFQVATYIRMLFSTLVDSDFTDTEEFCTNKKREIVHDSLSDLYKKLEGKFHKTDGTKLNNAREMILKNCIKKAESEPGLFTLTVPTGGGKTRSSLAFALKHAIKNDLRRVIYVVPYTTIIEQNAKDIKDILGENNVLEHHSNIQNHDVDEFKYRWATENWDIPIIITTNVQFFESLFSNKTSQVRKIHNITKSVVIFDEAQMLPIDYISPCMTIMSELITNYGCSAVLCSATQPTLQDYAYKSLIPAIEIAENTQQLFDDLKRVDYLNMGKQSDEEIIKDILEENTSALVVVNSRRHAYQLYEQACEKMENVYYLSTLLIPLHRSFKIQEIKKRLPNENIIVISTQLIEAGVDIDFPVVYRSLAGIDNIIQAGGRANREGKLTMGIVKVFEPTSDIGKIPRVIENSGKISREIFYTLKEKTYNLEGIEKFFKLYYSLFAQEDQLDKKRILSEFQVNNGEFTDGNFKRVAEKFKIIEDNTQSVVIECDGDITLCKDSTDPTIKLLHEGSKNIIKKIRNGEFDYKDIRKLQYFSVNIFSSVFEKLEKKNAIDKDLQKYGINILMTEKYYDKDKGLDIFSDENKNGECYHL